MRRVLVFSVLGFLGLTLLGPLQYALSMDSVCFDLALIIVLHVAMVDRRGGVFRSNTQLGLQSGHFIDLDGVLTVLILGYFVDLLGGGIKGFHGIAYAIVFLLFRSMARQIYMAGTISQVVVVFVASFGSSLFLLGLRWLIHENFGSAIFVVIIIQAILTAAIAPFVMRLLRQIDARLLDIGEQALMRGR